MSAVSPGKGAEYTPPESPSKKPFIVNTSSSKVLKYISSGELEARWKKVKDSRSLELQ